MKHETKVIIKGLCATALIVILICKIFGHILLPLLAGLFLLLCKCSSIGMLISLIRGNRQMFLFWLVFAIIYALGSM